MSPILRTTSLRARLKNQIHCRGRREEAQISDDLAKNQSLPMNPPARFYCITLIMNILQRFFEGGRFWVTLGFIGTMPLLFAVAKPSLSRKDFPTTDWWPRLLATQGTGRLEEMAFLFLRSKRSLPTELAALDRFAKVEQTSRCGRWTRWRRRWRGAGPPVCQHVPISGVDRSRVSDDA